MRVRHRSAVVASGLNRIGAPEWAEDGTTEPVVQLLDVQEFQATGLFDGVVAMHGEIVHAAEDAPVRRLRDSHILGVEEAEGSERKPL